MYTAVLTPGYSCSGGSRRSSGGGRGSGSGGGGSGLTRARARVAEGGAGTHIRGALGQPTVQRWNSALSVTLLPPPALLALSLG